MPKTRSDASIKVETVRFTRRTARRRCQDRRQSGASSWTAPTVAPPLCTVALFGTRQLDCTKVAFLVLSTSAGLRLPVSRGDKKDRQRIALAGQFLGNENGRVGHLQAPSLERLLAVGEACMDRPCQVAVGRHAEFVLRTGILGTPWHTNWRASKSNLGGHLQSGLP